MESNLFGRTLRLPYKILITKIFQPSFVSPSTLSLAYRIWLIGSRSHPENLGRRSAALPLLSRHHEKRRTAPVPRRDRVLSPPARSLGRHCLAPPPPPDPPFTIETLEPIDIALTWSWTDQIGPPPQGWWTEADKAWHAPELPLDDGLTLVFDADNSVTYDEFPVFVID